MNDSPTLLPVPRSLSRLGGHLELTGDRLIVLKTDEPQALRFTARRLQAALTEHAGISWQIFAGKGAPVEQVGISLNIVPAGTHHPQGYELMIQPEAIHIVASTPAGAFHGVSTLIQILAQSGRQLSALHVVDWPDYPNRGVMLDISRDKVPTMESLYALVDMLASWKINQFQLYIEHTFAYRNHPQIWAEASPITGEEVLALDAYCRERFVELVPNQNSFGHMRRWLVHDDYRPLAEAPNGCNTRWGYFDEPFTLCPGDPGSIELIRGLYDELLPHFSSALFNVGCDETVDLGEGRSQEAVADKGIGRVYLDFLMKIYREVTARGRTMQFWGDIIIQHPSLVPELPRDIIALEWGYEEQHPFANNGAIFADSGIPFYVCPGTSSWNTIAGRTENALGNMRSAAESGLAHGAVGYLNTDWGDNGHWQPLPVSYLGYAYGAAISWAQATNAEHDMVPALSRFAFGDPTGTMGQLAYDLGNIYREPGVRPHNSSILFRMMQTPLERWESGGFDRMSASDLQRTIEAIDGIIDEVPDKVSDPLTLAEYKWAADMLRHAARRGLWAQDGQSERGVAAPTREALAQDADRLIEEFRAIWMARNRPGGFRDSVTRLEKMRADYEER